MEFLRSGYLECVLFHCLISLCQVPTPTPTINSVFQSEESSYVDDVFFDSATPTSAYVQQFPHISHAAAAAASTAVDGYQIRPSFVMQG